MIRNPFDITNYSSSFIKENIIMNSSGIGSSGLSDLMSFITDQVKIRQKAIDLGYISNNPIPSPPNYPYTLINISNFNFDSPSGIYSASLKIVDAVRQMFSGHSSRIYENLVYRPTLLVGQGEYEGVYDILPGGFFHKIVNPLTDEPNDTYFFSIDDLIDGTHVKDTDICRFDSPPEYTTSYETFNQYIIDQVAWANSAIFIINKLKFIHRKLVFSYINAGADLPNSNCLFNESFRSTDPALSVNTPIEIILDMSEVISSCNDNGALHGFLCVSWKSSNKGSRFVIMPTRANDDQSTNALRSPLYGAPLVNPFLNTPYIPQGSTGYLDQSVYLDLVRGEAGQNPPLITWDPETQSPFLRQDPIAISGCSSEPCCLTSTFDPKSPFYNIESFDNICIKITDEYFTTDIIDPWSYKIRVIIFPGCGSETANTSWELNMKCLGCDNCINEPSLCGVIEESSSSSSSSGGGGGGSSSSSSSGEEIDICPSRPVENVSWDMIAAADGFNSLTGLRLPTEAEWEYAYRAGTTTAFHSFPGYTSGTNDDTLLGNIAWYSGNNGASGSSTYGTKAVGGKFANALGLHDMSGNIWEWCQDWYSDTYYASSPLTNPTGPTTGTTRLLRGSGWGLSSYYCRASRRGGLAPDVIGYVYGGFRVVRTP